MEFVIQGEEKANSLSLLRVFMHHSILQVQNLSYKIVVQMPLAASVRNTNSKY